MLLRHGYHGEYHGKYHSPYRYALEYTYPVRWVNGPRPAGLQGRYVGGEALQAYEAAHVPALAALSPANCWPTCTTQPYRPDPLDPAYGKTQKEVQQATLLRLSRNSGRTHHDRLDRQGRAGRPGAAQGWPVHADHFDQPPASADGCGQALLWNVSARGDAGVRPPSTIRAPIRPIAKKSLIPAYRDPKLCGT